jgi:hypothetical protein
MNAPIIVISIIVFALVVAAILWRIRWSSCWGKSTEDTIIEYVTSCRTTLYVSQETMDAIVKGSYRVSGRYRLVSVPKEIAEALSLGIWKCLTEDQFMATGYCPAAHQVLAFEQEKKA